MKIGPRRFLFTAFLVAVALAGIFSLVASTAPDGLERVAMDKGFSEKAGAAPVWKWALFPDYVAAGIQTAILGSAAARAGGVVVVFGIGYLIAAAITRKRPLP